MRGGALGVNKAKTLAISRPIIRQAKTSSRRRTKHTGALDLLPAQLRAGLSAIAPPVFVANTTVAAADPHDVYS